MQGKNWCVVSPFTPPTSKLQAFINSACNEVDCKEIRLGGSCYEPNTLENHASFVLNLIYRARGTCDSDIGNLVITDPCKFLIIFHLIISVCNDQSIVLFLLQKMLYMYTKWPKWYSLCVLNV